MREDYLFRIHQFVPANTSIPQRAVIMAINITRHLSIWVLIQSSEDATFRPVLIPENEPP